mgnify:CR=1 FL=1
MPALTPMDHDDAGPQLADEPNDSFPGLLVVRETGVTDTRIPSDGQAEHLRRSGSLLLPDLWGPWLFCRNKIATSIAHKLLRRSIFFNPHDS